MDELARKSIMGSLQAVICGNVVDQFCLKQAMKLYFDGNKQRRETMLNIGKITAKNSEERVMGLWKMTRVYFYTVG